MAEQMGGEPPIEVTDPLTIFIYLLMRDIVPPGQMEDAVLMAEEVREGNLSILTNDHHLLTNRFLGGYAQNVAERLRADGQGTVHPTIGECIIGTGADRRIWLCPVHGLLDPDSLDIEKKCAHCPDQPAWRFDYGEDAI